MELRLRGLTVFLTGLPGAGKSSIARALRATLLERDSRPVALLDGDMLRKHISPDLGFSKEDRNLNVLRAGLIAAQISRKQGIAICALIAPYDAARRDVRALIEGAACGFLLVHVATPLHVCEARDCKGLYARARQGSLPQFTGVTDPYEPPSDAELVIDATHISPEDAAQKLATFIEQEDEQQDYAPSAQQIFPALQLSPRAPSELKILPILQ